MPDVRLMLCTNDERGHDTGYATCVELHYGGVEVLRLECGYWQYRHSIVCRMREDRRLQFGRLRLAVNGYQDWVGNWCWSAVWLPYREAKRALVYLRGTGRFVVDSGITKACEWWDGMAERAVVNNTAHNRHKPFAIAHSR